MSAKGFLFDATTRNAVFIQRLAGGQYKDALKVLEKMERNVMGVVASLPEQVVGQQGAVIAVRSAVTEAMEELSGVVNQGAEDTADYIAGFTQRMLDKAATAEVAAPSVEAIKMAMQQAVVPVGQGVNQLTIAQAVADYGDAKATAISRALSDAMVLNATRGEAIERIRVATGMAKQQAETLVRTSTNAASQVGRGATFAQNRDILEGYEWVSVLDSRTTLECAGLDGRIFPIGQGPQPPAHWGCRSQIVAAVLPEYQQRGLEGERKAEGGEVTANTTYGSWLKRQPASFQNEALGDTRAALFRRGGLDIDKFTDPTGQRYTIAELRQLEPMAFEKANL